MQSVRIYEFYEQIIPSYSDGFLSWFYSQTSEMCVFVYAYICHMAKSNQISTFAPTGGRQMPNCDIWRNIYEFSLFFVCVRTCVCVRFMKYVLAPRFKSLRRLNDLYYLSSPSLISLGA